MRNSSNLHPLIDLVSENDLYELLQKKLQDKIAQKNHQGTDYMIQYTSQLAYYSSLRPWLYGSLHFLCQ